MGLFAKLLKHQGPTYVLPGIRTIVIKNGG